MADNDTDMRHDCEQWRCDAVCCAACRKQWDDSLAQARTEGERTGRANGLREAARIARSRYAFGLAKELDAAASAPSEETPVTLQAAQDALRMCMAEVAEIAKIAGAGPEESAIDAVRKLLEAIDVSLRDALNGRVPDWP